MKKLDNKIFELDESAEALEEACEHEFDINEGYTCLNCGEQGDIGALIDATEYLYDIK